MGLYPYGVMVSLIRLSLPLGVKKDPLVDTTAYTSDGGSQAKRFYTETKFCSFGCGVFRWPWVACVSVFIIVPSNPHHLHQPPVCSV